MESELLTAGQIAKRLKVSRSYVYKQFEQGKLPGLKLSAGVLRFTVRDVEAWLKTKAV